MARFAGIAQFSPSPISIKLYVFPKLNVGCAGGEQLQVNLSSSLFVSRDQLNEKTTNAGTISKMSSWSVLLCFRSA